MKELTAQAASALAKGDPENAKVLLLSNQGLDFILSCSATSRNAVKADGLVDPSFPIVLARLHDKEKEKKKKQQQHLDKMGGSQSPPRVGQQKQLQQQHPKDFLPHFSLPQVCIVDASHNGLSRADELWEIFPAAWWVNLSNNKLSSADPDTWPLALGELDLSHNSLSANALFRLSSCHIMRLKTKGNPLNEQMLSHIRFSADPSIVEAETKEIQVEKKERLRRLSLMLNLPNLWVINDDFVSSLERKRIAAAKLVDCGAGENATEEAAGADLTTEAAETTASALRPPPLAISPRPATDQVAPAARSVMDDEDDDEMGVLPSQLNVKSGPPEVVPKPAISLLANSWASRLQPGWGTRAAALKVSNFVKMTQIIPEDGGEADAFRLDVLLEDYLQQARMWNQHAVGMQPAHERHRMPTVDLLLLLHLPHHLRLDLCVLLSITLVFDIPRHLLVDALIALLGTLVPYGEVEDLIALPSFARTALVSLLRRVSRRELEELTTLGRLTDKPTRARFPYLARGPTPEALDAPDPPEPTYQGPEGFAFLYPLLLFLNRPLGKMRKLPESTAASHHAAFSELELEILHYLPDVVTRSTRPMDPVTSHRDWLAFASRHTVLLLAKSQYCPSLTRAQVTVPKQDLYTKLLPILRAASMRYEDLELAWTGPEKDGRIDDNEGGVFVPFGTGLPKGQKHHLLWNKRNLTIIRGYRTPWSEYATTGPVSGTGGGGGGDAMSQEGQEIAEAQADEEPDSPQPSRPATGMILAAVFRSLSSVEIRHLGANATHSSSAATGGSGGHSLHVDTAGSVMRGASLQSAIAREFSLPESAKSADTPRSRSRSPSSLSPPRDPKRRVDGLAVGSSLDDTAWVGEQVSRAAAATAATRASAGSLLQRTMTGGVATDSAVSLDLSDAGREMAGQTARSADAMSSLHVVPNSCTSAPLSLVPPQARFSLDSSQDGARNLKLRAMAAPKVVKGFAADAEWDAQFLLAPPRAVKKHNQDHRRQDGEAVGQSTWNSLQQAPVLVHPNCPKMVPQLLDLGDNQDQASRSPRDLDDGDAPSRRGPPESPATAARRLLAEMGTLRNLRSQGLGLGNSGAAAQLLALADGRGQTQGQGLATSPLARIRPKSGGKGKRGFGMSASAGARGGAGGLSLSPRFHPVLGALLLQSGTSGAKSGLDKGKPIGKDKSDPSTTYLTALPDGQGDADPDADADLDGRGEPAVIPPDDSSHASESTAFSAAALFRAGPSKAEQADTARTAELRRYLSSSMSSAEVLRMQHNYPLLFIAGHGQGKAADVGTSGRTLSSARYPCFGKVVYTLDKQALPLALMRIAQQSGYLLAHQENSNQGTGANQDGEMLAPSLFQNSELTLQAGRLPARTPPLRNHHVGLVGSEGIIRQQPQETVSGSGFELVETSKPDDAAIDDHSRDQSQGRGKSQRPGSRPLTMTDSLMGFSSTGELTATDSRNGALVTDGSSSRPRSQLGATNSHLQQTSSMELYIPVPDGLPLSPVPSVAPNSIDHEQDLTAPMKGQGAAGTGYFAPPAPAVSTAAAAAAVQVSMAKFVRQVAKPVRPMVFREDPDEPSVTTCPPRGRILTVPSLASARLQLNTAFRVTRKPGPQPALLLSEVTGAGGDSVVRFDAQGKKREW